MPNTKITITYKDFPIRIYGLPDEPVFNLQDIISILGKKPSFSVYDLIPQLERFIVDIGKKKVSVINTAGLYKMIFIGSDEIKALDFEKFFIQKVEPALRKYGYPAEKSSC